MDWEPQKKMVFKRPGSPDMKFQMSAHGTHDRALTLKAEVLLKL